MQSSLRVNERRLAPFLNRLEGSPQRGMHLPRARRSKKRIQPPPGKFSESGPGSGSSLLLWFSSPPGGGEWHLQPAGKPKTSSSLAPLRFSSRSLKNIPLRGHCGDEGQKGARGGCCGLTHRRGSYRGGRRAPRKNQGSSESHELSGFDCVDGEADKEQVAPQTEWSGELRQDLNKLQKT